MTDTEVLNGLLQPIEEDLNLVERTLEQATTSDIDILTSAVVHLLGSRGKRLRMALTLLSGKLINYRVEKLLPMSVALELVHLATLVHDDVVDRATTRRGIPTANALFGNNIAILLGDFLFAKTAGLVAQVEDFRIDRLFSDTVTRLCEGTIAEMMSAYKLNLSIADYTDRINRKTAVLLASCARGGALVAGATDAEAALLEQYGTNLGIAFQIVDDILDYVSTDATIGKPAGNDLRNGLVTLPLILALQKDKTGRKAEVTNALATGAEVGHVSAEEVHSIVGWVNKGSAIGDSIDLARHYASRARAVLSEFGPSPARDTLVELVDFVVERKL